MAQVRVQIKSWNAEKLLGRSTQILEDFAPIIAEEARRQIVSPVWSWPNKTFRFKSLYQAGTPITAKSGSAVLIPGPPTKRDIVDRGTLLNSQQAPQVSGKALSIRWTAPYSGLVLAGGNYGSYTNPFGSVVDVGERPARNWISAAYKAEPFLPFFVKRWNELSGASRA
jgi:hypothetical protein